MKQVIFKITVLFIFLTGLALGASAKPGDDSLVNKKAAAIREHLFARIQENQRLAKEGREAEENYVVTDDGKEPDYFFKYFRSNSARKFWIDRGWPENLSYFLDRTLDKDGVREGFLINDWIRLLRKTYLENTPYKDYQIYFVISGIYNYKNLDAEEGDYDWAKVKTESFSKTVKEDKTSDSFSPRENGVINAILKQVGEPIENIEFSKAQNKPKFIVFYLFNFYINQQPLTIVSQGTTGVGPKISIEHGPPFPTAFVLSGCSHSTDIDASVISDFFTYNTAHQVNDNPATTTGNIVTRSDYFVQMIRNVFTFFAAKSGSAIPNADCVNDKDLIARLEVLYKEPLPNSSTSIAGSLVDLPLSTRTCLLQKMSEKFFCGDGSSQWLSTNFCENLILDIVASTPQEQRLALLEYLGSNNGVLFKLLAGSDDLSTADALPYVMDIVEWTTKMKIPIPPDLSGRPNYTALVYLLCQFAYEEYSDRILLYHEQNDDKPCGWIPYDPTATQQYSKNIKGSHKADNTIIFDYNGSSDFALCSNILPDNLFASIPFKKELMPFDFIGIIPETDLPIKFMINGEESAFKNRRIVIPALLLYYNIDKTITQRRLDNVQFIFKVISFARGEYNFKFNPKGSLVQKANDILKIGQELNTIGTTVTSAPQLKQWLNTSDGGKKFLKVFEHASGIDATISIKDIAKGEALMEPFKNLVDAVAYWCGDAAQDPLVYTDANFLYINEPLSSLEIGLLNDGLMSKSTRNSRKTDIDGMFLEIKGEQGFQGFRYFYLNNPTATVQTMDVADKEWDTKVANWRKRESEGGYNIGATRNLARVIYPWDEFLVASGKAYNKAMAKTFIPESFYTLMDNDANRVFTPRTQTRKWDTDIIALEYYAYKQHAVKGGKYPNIVEDLTMYTDLIPCPSCSYVMAQFVQMFPNVKLHVITTKKINY
ncbi:deaminase domain-containing protein [Chitinophaga silvisoli]|uniref:CMP/dCMP-type deaminase domain-containing protein n=1 Tax=Chitinophaga silvisoli TaxID=2291814 RepID=A0A3E1P9E3_9BACT|nr:deaminase domain-containing protein [Chitinophaga silvisoli]RFM36802.1 hypothetical protein DXN04_04695 [Chitinophaga silvisoli]